ncbi:tRNA glutamyl-Q(34) synthetase GluQRS [Deinococcus radiopugnans]|uniref:Glutamyl-Q tRNA(Asp) synthetase n=1 Tax=Deinococcus radiopugnans ATCC 19172 TaxID=585398 RepID=A0A5C4Y8M8_9DEIO|nr:tRNA glutamyl-Q(34) synthetase GluQRS [Deinococcus radiopugnans]MBB6014841.1 glutamyl-tRNA synthetase [Deinococcus radiopugnans ATCC 19172]TNM71733.1 tRNA glutamyl-Q(34) synthetase GluQRS [Deinococcus radiopugnans ATCC 19172]
MTVPARPVVGRFAPSPTGAMHLGNARTALLAWLHTRAQGGRHILRFEDLDTGRVRGWAYDATRRDLEWLGLDWDAEYLQSERLPLYAEALGRLDTYPCTCTRREIAAAAQASAGAPHGEEAVYPGLCRAGRDPNRPASRRWRVPDETVCVSDELTGANLCQSLRSDVGDFVLQRNDGVFAYHLAVVVDDAEMGVTDILRGADLWMATPRQVALQEALGYPTPRYLHVPLMTDFRGERLAKRDGAPPLMALREAGELPGKVLAELARSLGWPPFDAVPDAVTATELIPLWHQSVHFHPVKSLSQT